jgi:hypothetical protein
MFWWAKIFQIFFKKYFIDRIEKLHKMAFIYFFSFLKKLKKLELSPQNIHSEPLPCILFGVKQKSPFFRQSTTQVDFTKKETKNFCFDKLSALVSN